MKNGNNRRRATALKATIKQYESELNIGAKILEWEIGDLWGHVGVRLQQSRRAPAVAAVRGDEHLGLRVVDAVGQ